VGLRPDGLHALLMSEPGCFTVSKPSGVPPLPELAPDAIAGLYRGENLGKRLIRIASGCDAQQGAGGSAQTGSAAPPSAHPMPSSASAAHSGTASMPGARRKRLSPG
jgi:hypothetical protein